MSELDKRAKTISKGLESDIGDLIKDFHKMLDIHLPHYQREIDKIIKGDIKRQDYIENIMDNLVDLSVHSEGFMAEFKRLCRFYMLENPASVGWHIESYLRYYADDLEDEKDDIPEYK